MKLFSKPKSVIVLALAAVAGVAVACGDDDAAKSSSSSSTGGTTSSSSSSTSGGASSSSSGGSTLSLYDRLGGKEGLEAFVQGVVDNHITKDPDTLSFFFNQTNASGIPAGHPSVKQIVVCFGRFVGAALGKDQYPGDMVSDPANTKTPNFTCRTMETAHKGADTMLHIGSGTFDKFIGFVAADLTKLVKPQATMKGEITQAEFDMLAAALNGQKGNITTAGASPDAGPFPN